MSVVVRHWGHDIEVGDKFANSEKIFWTHYSKPILREIIIPAGIGRIQAKALRKHEGQDGNCQES